MICRHQTIMATDWLTYVNEITCILIIVDFLGMILWKVKKKLLIDFFLLSSPVFSLVKLFDVLDFNPLFSEVPCSLYFSSHASVNNFTTHSFDNCSKSLAHTKWVHNKKNMFAVNTVISDIEKFDEIQSLVSNMNHQGQGDSTKTYWHNYTLYKNAGFWLVNSRDIFF